MTSLRECQALMSLRLINQPLQQLLLSTTMPSEGFSSDSNLGKSGIPEKLWEAMQKTFNTSQLRAICNISTQVTALSDTASPNVHPSVAKIGFDAATISLLQGPPGTGKQYSNNNSELV